MVKVLEGHIESVLAVAMMTHTGKILSGSLDKTVRVWSTETGQVLFVVC